MTTIVLVRKNNEVVVAGDGQTSGGLLISCNPKDTKNIIDRLNENSIYKSKIIGKFILKDNYNIICH